jgi:UDP-glucose:(heptosyl)LPS alpha-1,3-glucosyltransferase
VKILFCIDKFIPSRGGAETYLKELGVALKEKGHAVTVATCEGYGDSPLDILHLKAPGFSRLIREAFFSFKIREIKRKGLFDRIVGFRHMLDVDRYQPHEGLFIDSIYGSFRSKSSRPLLHACLLFKKLLSAKNLFFLYTDHALFRAGSVKVAALSEGMAASICRRYTKYKPQVTVIPHGVNRKRFHPDLRNKLGNLTRKALGIPPQGRIVLFLSHNFGLKGLKYALGGIAHYKDRAGDPYLLIAGRGKARKYEKQCRSLGLDTRAIFLGERQSVEALYAAADVLIHPTFYDPCSLVVLEALGAGVPVITTAFNGASELMANSKAGQILEDPRNQEDMAEALRRVLNPRDHASYRENAVRLGAACDFSNHVDKMEAWITG